MQRKGLALSIALLATVGVASAVAAAGGGFSGKEHGHGGWHEGRHGGHHGAHRGHHGGKKHGKMGRMMMLKKLDADKDGTVTLEEFLKPKSESFAELDKNSDGALDASELTARMQEKAGQRQRMMMARLDADGDGKVTKDEFEKSSQRGWRGKHRGHRGHHGERHRMNEEMKKQQADAADGDDEAENGADDAKSERGRGNRSERITKRFERLDANSDGVITIEDLQARSSERISWMQKKRLHVLDKNSDGKVSSEEFAARSKQRFGDIDLDNDGKITVSDLPPWAADRWNKKSDQSDK